MATTRAKFKLDSHIESKHSGGSSHKLSFSPVFSNNPGSENNAFWQATPNGRLELDGLKPEVVAGFEPGKEYYLDITLAE